MRSDKDEVNHLRNFLNHLWLLPWLFSLCLIIFAITFVFWNAYETRKTIQQNHAKLMVINAKEHKAVVKHIFIDNVREGKHLYTTHNRCIVEETEHNRRYIVEIEDKIPLVGEVWKIHYTYINGEVPSDCILLEKAE